MTAIDLGARVPLARCTGERPTQPGVLADIVGRLSDGADQASALSRLGGGRLLVVVANGLSGRPVPQLLAARARLGRGPLVLAGVGAGGVLAMRLAAEPGVNAALVIGIDAPSALAAPMPRRTRLLCLASRADSTAALGALVTFAAIDRVTVLYPPHADPAIAWLSAAQAIDRSTHPVLRAEVSRLRRLGVGTAA